MSAVTDNNVVAIGADFQIIHIQTVDVPTRTKAIKALQNNNKNLDSLTRICDGLINELYRLKLQNIEIMEVLSCQNQ